MGQVGKTCWDGLGGFEHVQVWVEWIDHVLGWVKVKVHGFLSMQNDHRND